MNKVSSRDYGKGDKLIYRGRNRSYTGTVVQVFERFVVISIRIGAQSLTVHFPHEEMYTSCWVLDRRS